VWSEFPYLEPHETDEDNPYTRVRNRHPRTRPKPDLTYAFPISHQPIERLPAFERDELSRTFSRDSLGELSKMGVICAPTTGLRKWTQSPQSTFLSTKDLACFPWAIVEFKRQVQGSEVAPKERCYCQAANASAAALALQAQLSAKAMEMVTVKDDKDEQRKIDNLYSRLSPIVSFTCVGPIVKVWLTYYKERNTEAQRERVSVHQRILA
jgi:hypothetical protein